MDELWGLAVLPSQSQFVTVGYDKMLCLWDTLTHTAVWTKEMPVSLSVHRSFSLYGVCINMDLLCTTVHSLA